MTTRRQERGNDAHAGRVLMLAVALFLLLQADRLFGRPGNLVVAALFIFAGSAVVLEGLLGFGCWPKYAELTVLGRLVWWPLALLSWIPRYNAVAWRWIGCRRFWRREAAGGRQK